MQDFNAPSALYAAVKANDLDAAKKLLEAGAKPDSHLLAMSLRDDFAIQEDPMGVGPHDLKMAELLIQHGADVNGNDHEPIIAAYAQPSVLGMMFLQMYRPECDYRAAMRSAKSLPKYATPEFERAKFFLTGAVRRQPRRLRDFLPAFGAKKPGGPG